MPVAPVTALVPVAQCWSMLDGVNRLTAIEYHGTDASALDYVASRTLIAELTWLGHRRSAIEAEHE